MDTTPAVVESRGGADDTGSNVELGKAKELLKPQDGVHPDCFADGFFSGIDFSILSTADRAELGMGISLNQ